MDKNKFLQNRFVSWVVHFFTTNILLKGFALALTVLIFALAPKEEPEMKEFSNVPVRIRVSGKNIMVNDKSATVRVILKGRKIDPRLTAESLKLELDTKDGVLSEDKGYFSWNLKTSDVKGIPWGLNCDSVSPETLTLPTDTLGKRHMKVEAVFADNLPEHLTLGKVTVTPGMVLVEGPSSRLRALKSIPTVPIRLQGVNHSFDCDQKLDQSQHASFQFSPGKVLVQVEVLPAVFDRKFEKVPVRVLTSPDRPGKRFFCRILSDAQVDVTLTGKKDVIESLRKEDFFPYVDISGFTNPGRYEMDVRCAFELSSVRVKEFSPKRISILLTEAAEVKK